MEKRTITIREIGLPKPAEGRFPKRRGEESIYAKPTLELLEEETKKYRLFDVTMSVDHGSGTATFEY